IRSSIPKIRLYSLRVAVMSNMRLASSGTTLTEPRDEARSSPGGGPPGSRDAGSTGRGGCAKGWEPGDPDRPGSTKMAGPDDGGRSSGRVSVVVRASPPLPVPGRVVAGLPP